MKMFDKITFMLGTIFFGGWVLLGTFFYCKAVIDFILSIV